MPINKDEVLTEEQRIALGCYLTLNNCRILTSRLSPNPGEIVLVVPELALRQGMMLEKVQEVARREGVQSEEVRFPFRRSLALRANPNRVVDLFRRFS